MVRIVTILAAAACAASCSPTATIHLRGNERTEGEILESNPAALYVRTADGERTIPRGKVKDIDHPGTTAMVVGTVLSIAGLSAGVHAGAQWQETPMEERNRLYAQMGAGGVALITGIALAAYGASVHGESKKNSYPKQTRKLK
jgi:hypothetical protein